MAKVSKKSGGTIQMPKERPAISPEAREEQMVSLAYDVAEERMRNGTASSQEIVHFLKLGTAKAKAEQAKLEKEVELVSAKTEAIQVQKELASQVEEAISAFKSYTGTPDEPDEEDYDDDYDD